MVSIGQDVQKFIHGAYSFLLQKGFERLEGLINVLVRVSNQIKVQFDLAEDVELDQDSQESNDMLIFVGPPTDKGRINGLLNY